MFHGNRITMCFSFPRTALLVTVFLLLINIFSGIKFSIKMSILFTKCSVKVISAGVVNDTPNTDNGSENLKINAETKARITNVWRNSMIDETVGSNDWPWVVDFLLHRLCLRLSRLLWHNPRQRPDDHSGWLLCNIHIALHVKTEGKSIYGIFCNFFVNSESSGSDHEWRGRCCRILSQELEKGLEHRQEGGGWFFI